MGRRLGDEEDGGWRGGAGEGTGEADRREAAGIFVVRVCPAGTY